MRFKNAIPQPSSTMYLLFSVHGPACQLDLLNSLEILFFIGFRNKYLKRAENPF